MKGKNIVYLLVVLVLGGVAAWLLAGRDNSTTLEERKMDYSFTVTDTASIDRIVLSDKTPSEVSLVRSGSGWLVNGEHPVRKDAMQTLLETMYRMRMRNFIPESMQPTVMKRMSVYGKDVKLYSGDKLVKRFFVGTESEDEMATYMMIEGADAPYAVHIPGFNGFLSTRFFTEPHLWRRQDITSMDPRQIRSVEMYYPDSSLSSFRLEAQSWDDIRLTNLKTGNEMPVADLNRARFYLAAVGKMNYEGVIVPSDPIYSKRDSLLANEPVFELEVTDRSGEKLNLKGYKIKGPAETFDPDVEAPEYDPDRMHGFVNEEEMVLLQYYGLRKVLQPVDFFTQP